ncbi:MAG: aminotransferase class IV, partial [Thermoanaerobaculia bacterium]
MKKVMLNGNLLTYGRAKISVFDRGFLFGDGVYEVCKVKKGKVLFLEEHLERLRNSLKEALIPYPENFEEHLKEYLNLLKKEIGGLYIQITRGAHLRNHIPPEGLKPNYLIFYFPYKFHNLKEIKEGFKALAIADFRWERCDIKTISLMGPVLSKIKAKKEGFDEVLFYDSEGNIREGASTNFYAVKDDKVYTHPLGNYLLKGVTRENIFKICQNLNIEIIEEPPNIKEIENWDEAFISGTLTG